METSVFEAVPQEIMRVTEEVLESWARMGTAHLGMLGWVL